MTELKPQKRGRRIAMSDAERDAFLAEQRTCRVATIGPDGPHATPLWFVWDGTALWLYSIVKSQRWADLQRDPRIGIAVDTGEQFLELRGVEITGRVEIVGDVPRVQPDSDVDSETDSVLADAERRFADKYMDGAAEMYHDGRHGWLRVTPAKITSWDFRKIGS